MRIYALHDHPFDTSGKEVVHAAVMRGHGAKLFRYESDVGPAGYVFTRIAQHPPRIGEDRAQVRCLHASRSDCKFIQDKQQVDLYEDKLAQTEQFCDWMPYTNLLYSESKARTVLPGWAFPFISKSAIGSASHAVRLITSKEQAQREIEQVFGAGMALSSAGPGAVQKGYLIWQEFIPHTVTWRVAIAGSKINIYKRFCYPDRPMAAPSKVVPTEPVTAWTPQMESLVDFSQRFFRFAGTKWCAIDVLETPTGWRLLETSLAWARCKRAAEFKFMDSKHSLATQHALLIEEIEAGVFG